MVYKFTGKSRSSNAYSEQHAKKWAQTHPDDILEIYDNGVKIDECMASDCFNTEPKEREKI